MEQRAKGLSSEGSCRLLAGLVETLHMWMQLEKMKKMSGKKQEEAGGMARGTWRPDVSAGAESGLWVAL